MPSINPRPNNPRPTDAELDILSVIWDLAAATVREVHTELSKTRELGYTTVLKLMQIMTEKGLLIRDESQRSHIYRAKQREGSTQKQLVKHLVGNTLVQVSSWLVAQNTTRVAHQCPGNRCPLALAT